MKDKKFKIGVLSGKGGVGKSMLTSSLAILFSKREKIIALDCDADAPNLDIWLGGIKKWDKIIPIKASFQPVIDYRKCNNCGLCVKNCPFRALEKEKDRIKLNPFLCEGCGVCEIVCPKKAINLKLIQNGEIRIKQTKYNFPLISGQLYPGKTGSGKVVSEIKSQAEMFDYNLMLCDCAPGTGCPVIACVRDLNFAILITEPSLSGFSDLKRVLKVLYHFNISWGLVINKWDINVKISNKIKKWAKNRFLGKISYDSNIFKAISNLVPILQTDLKAKAEIIQIYKNFSKYYAQA